MAARISEIFLYKESGKGFFIMNPNLTKKKSAGSEGSFFLWGGGGGGGGGVEREGGRSK